MSELKHVNFYDAWSILSDEMLFIFRTYTEGFKFCEFIKLIAPENNWQIGGVQIYGTFSGMKIEGAEPEEYWVRVIRVCLHNLKFMKMRVDSIQLNNIGDPDPTLFEISEGSREMFARKENHEN